jgi:tetratricopeptide (TPR) repeat protein
VLVGLGRDDEALPYLREAAALFAQLEDHPNEVLMRRRLALVYEHLHQLTDALEAWSQVRLLDRASGNLAGEAEAVEGMARTERKLARAASDVIARYDEALVLASRLGDRKRELAVRNALGIVHWQRGAYSDALRQYESALRLCRETGDRVHEGLILNSLGATLHRLRRWDEARTTLSEAAHVNAETGERQLRAHALATLGDVCLASGRLDEALLDFEASLALRRELEDHRGENAMLDRIARVHAAKTATAAAIQP